MSIFNKSNSDDILKCEVFMNAAKIFFLIQGLRWRYPAASQNDIMVRVARTICNGFFYVSKDARKMSKDEVKKFCEDLHVHITKLADLVESGQISLNYEQFLCRCMYAILNQGKSPEGELWASSDSMVDIGGSFQPMGGRSSQHSLKIREYLTEFWIGTNARYEFLNDSGVPDVSRQLPPAKDGIPYGFSRW